jgi:hypothetical protein
VATTWYVDPEFNVWVTVYVVVDVVAMENPSWLVVSPDRR